VGNQAEQTIRGLEKARTAATKPLFDFAAFDQIPQKTANDLLKEIARIRSQDKTGVFAPQLNYLQGLITASPAVPATPAMRTLVQRQGQQRPIYQHAPATPGMPAQVLTDTSNLSRARRVMNNRIELQPFAADAVDKETAGAVLDITNKMNDLMARASPAYAAGNRLFKEMTPGVVAKQEGTLGGIARAQTAEAQFERLIHPQQSTPTTVQTTARDLQRPLPFDMTEMPGGASAYPDLVRYGLEQQLNRAQRALSTNDKSFVGAKFARGVGETPMQKANVLTAIEELPNGKTLRQGFANLLDVLEATGNRLPVGSRTAFNARSYEDMTSGVAKDLLRSPTVNVGLKPLFNIWDNWSVENWQKLLTDKNSVAQLRKLAMMKPTSDAARALVGSILSNVRDPTETKLSPPKE
jgi:hypothetical protein